MGAGGGGGGVGGAGWRWGGGGKAKGVGFFSKEPLCPVRNRLWSMSLRGVGGLFLHGKAAIIQHAARVGGP